MPQQENQRVVQRDVVVAVDDDPSFLRSLERLLKANAMEVRTFPSAEALQEHGDLSDAVCLLLDIHLGGTSGIELEHSLRRRGSTVPVVFMTANDNAATRRAVSGANCVAYLRKPFPEADLLEAIAKASRAVSG
jgi:FixJ family two-component response regulator